MIVRQHIGDPQCSEVTIGTFPLLIRCCRMNGSQSRDKKYLKKKKNYFKECFYHVSAHDRIANAVPFRIIKRNPFKMVMVWCLILGMPVQTSAELD